MSTNIKEPDKSIEIHEAILNDPELNMLNSQLIAVYLSIRVSYVIKTDGQVHPLHQEQKHPLISKLKEAIAHRQLLIRNSIES